MQQEIRPHRQMLRKIRREMQRAFDSLVTTALPVQSPARFIVPHPVHVVEAAQERSVMHIPETHLRAYRDLPLNEQYARLCAHGDGRYYGARYLRGLKLFPLLLAVEGVTAVGIDWTTFSLILGTECVTFESSGKKREIGEFIVKLQQRPPGYAVENTTRVINDAGHPHGRPDGSLCMSIGNQEVHMALADGDFHIAADILVTALYMRADAVSRGQPTCAYEHWPEISLIEGRTVEV